MTLHNPWTIVRQYYLVDRILDIFGCKPTLEQRLTAQVTSLRNMTTMSLVEAQQRLRILESKSDAMDAYYMKVLGSALKQHVDARLDLQDSKLANLEAKSFRGFQQNDEALRQTREALDRNSAELARTNSRISSILANLRKLGEGNS
jgi:hypothetical protein